MSLAVRLRLVGLAAAVPLALLGTTTVGAASPGAAAPNALTEVTTVTGGPLVAAAGDISCPVNLPSGRSCRAAATGDLVRAADPRAVLGLGDHQYPEGELANFREDYDAVWGSFKAKHYPVPGNHEYLTTGASGYYTYFGARSHPGHDGYYAYDLGTWRVYALNTNCAEVSCARERSWLAADLAANPRTCSLVYGHHPIYSSGRHGGEASMQPFASTFTTGGVDLYISGHDHDYERFGVRPDESFRQFVVGTGGAESRRFFDVMPHSQVRLRGFGVALFRLRADTYTWQFNRIDGTTPDSGASSCT